MNNIVSFKYNIQKAVEYALSVSGWLPLPDRGSVTVSARAAIQADCFSRRIFIK